MICLHLIPFSLPPFSCLYKCANKALNPLNEICRMRQVNTFHLQSHARSYFSEGCVTSTSPAEKRFQRMEQQPFLAFCSSARSFVACAWKEGRLVSKGPQTGGESTDIFGASRQGIRLG